MDELDTGTEIIKIVKCKDPNNPGNELLIIYKTDKTTWIMEEILMVYGKNVNSSYTPHYNRQTTSFNQSTNETNLKKIEFLEKKKDIPLTIEQNTGTLEVVFRPSEETFRFMVQDASHLAVLKIANLIVSTSTSTWLEYDFKTGALNPLS